jgi:hypothetical protein
MEVSFVFGDRMAAHAPALAILFAWLRLSEQNFRVDKWSLCRV